MPLFDSNSIKRMMPTFLRGLVHVAWLRVNMVRAKAINDVFEDLKAKADEKRIYSSQTGSLEAYLRLKYSDNNIFVENLSNGADIVYINWLFEAQTITYARYLSEVSSPVYVRYLSEYSNSQLVYDFVVQFPASFSGDEDEIRAIVNCMKLAGKRWRLEFV